jgi:CTP:molybdopterin cytidylyltransferase MocA
MSEITLLVLAAGIGRRFEGLKQVERVGASGEAIVDYAVYDALRSGFGRIVFVIRREIEEAFRRSIGDFWESRASVQYVYQEVGGAPAAGD